MRNCKKVFKCLPVCALPDVTKYLPEKWAEERERAIKPTCLKPDKCLIPSMTSVEK